MNQFTIRDIENLSGIKAHTLRIWEQRYNLITPKRKESNHRFYDNEDLKHILRISYLYHNGLKISKIADLQEDDIKQIISNKKVENESEYLINQLMEASLDYNDEKFEEVINTSLETLGVEDSILQVVYPFLQKIGLLWLTEHLIPAQEHFSSNIISRKLLVAIDSLKQAPAPQQRVVLLFTPATEHHEIPILFVQYLLKKNGHKVVYFGDNIKLGDIKLYTDVKHVTHIHFHLITNFFQREMDQYILDLSKQFFQQQIIMSGPSVKDVRVKPENVRLLHSMDELLAYARE